MKQKCRIIQRPIFANPPNPDRSPGIGPNPMLPMTPSSSKNGSGVVEVVVGLSALLSGY